VRQCPRNLDAPQGLDSGMTNPTAAASATTPRSREIEHPAARSEGKPSFTAFPNVSRVRQAGPAGAGTVATLPRSSLGAGAPSRSRHQKSAISGRAGRHPAPVPEGRLSARYSAARSDTVFCSRVANSLEMRRSHFHYYVTDRFTTILLATSYTGSHLLSDEVLTSDFEVAASGAGAPGGDE
jgi:hypothetical protein